MESDGGDPAGVAVGMAGQDDLAAELDPGLTCFREPAEQIKALRQVAVMPTGRVVVARGGGLVVGYAAVHPPDARSRWGEAGLEWLLELGAIEVAPRFRREGIGKRLLAVLFDGGRLEDRIVIALALWWHWDLRRTGLNLWAYQEMLSRLLGSCGFRKEPTADREVIAHPANAVFARRGRLVAPGQDGAFVELCRRPQLS